MANIPLTQFNRSNSKSGFKTPTKDQRDAIMSAAWGTPCPTCDKPLLLGQRLTVRLSAVYHSDCRTEA